MNDDEYERQKKFLFQEARLGIEMQDFLHSAAGRYLLHRCTQAIEESRDQLEKAPDLKTVRLHQRDSRIARLAMQWIKEAVLHGEQAAQELEQLES